MATAWPHPPRRRTVRRGRPDPVRGISLIEITFALIILTIAVLALISAIYSSQSLRETIREKEIANNAARKMIERLHDAAFDQIFANYSSGGGPGNVFPYAGDTSLEKLNPIPGTPLGQIFFPTAGGALSETVTDAQFPRAGMPRDLNGDGDALDADVSASYRLLPVRILVRWQGLHGPNQIELSALIAER